MVEMVSLVDMDMMDCLVLKDPKDLKENLVQQMVLQGPQGQPGVRGATGPQGSSIGPAGPRSGGRPTPSGERVPAQTLQELTLEELEGLTIHTKEVQQTTFACL